MSVKPEMTNVLQFMELRAPFSPEAEVLRQSYIRDDIVVEPLSLEDLQALKPARAAKYKPGRNDEDLQSDESPSAIGQLIYKEVFCKPDDGALERILDAVLNLLTPYEPLCPVNGEKEGIAKRLQPVWISELEHHPHIIIGNLYYLLPEKLEQIDGLIWFPQLMRGLDAMEKAGKNFHLSKLVKKLEEVFDAATIREVVFKDGSYSGEFRAAKRTLFDTLYLLYILRRRAPVNLEYVMEGLRVLHVLEALAIDSLIKASIAAAKAGPPLSASDGKLRKTLEVLFPELQGWNGKDHLASLPLIQHKSDFEAYFTATPIIHPIFARLHWYKQPFNDIKPIGIGDLKVVQQWLVEYLPGEISHVENVLKGETRNRTHRHLEKSEDTFSFSSSSKESSQKDTQSTNRFELKTEVDNVVKTDLNIGATANITYKGNPILDANLGATFGYKRDTSDETKTSTDFSRETIHKATQEIEKNVSQQRSATKLFETEETDVHSFTNIDPAAGHISGIYRWLDKKYKAQLFNYGKRMMFEFVIPEPAAFFVESRLRAFESVLEIPARPTLQLNTVELNFAPPDIKKPEFGALRMLYDLSEFTFPEASKLVTFVDDTGQTLLSEDNVPKEQHYHAKTYTCQLAAKGYTLRKLIVRGLLEFHNEDEDIDKYPQVANTMVLKIDGEVINNDWVNVEQFKFYKLDGEQFSWAGPGLTFNEEEVSLEIGFWDIWKYSVSVNADLKLSDGALLEWQRDVYKKVLALEQEKVDKANQEAQLVYNTQLSTYLNRLDELRAKTVNELLQGQSESFNRDIIATELKKHCLTMLTKEFDSDDSDDVLAKKLGIQNRPNQNFEFHHFKVTENGATTGSFELQSKDIKYYPAIALDDARMKGRFVQFLEQAFEWQQLAYIFYPYFWATPPRWIDMMNRLDDNDSNMTAFLRAGSVRVLLAVTPAYDRAVLHYIATREPWDGGPSPVIGDPLFIPLHEEIRKQQDDLYTAVPEGEPWTFTLPTSLVYLDASGAKLPTFPDLPIP